jgi:hypothetical protein
MKELDKGEKPQGRLGRAYCHVLLYTFTIFQQLELPEARS